MQLLSICMDGAPCTTSITSPHGYPVGSTDVHSDKRDKRDTTWRRKATRLSILPPQEGLSGVTPESEQVWGQPGLGQE